MTMRSAILTKAGTDPAPVRLLDALRDLPADDRRALAQALAGRERDVGARRDAVSEGDRCNSVLFVLSGWGCRYKQLPDGRRQTVAILLPGDMCDAGVALLEEMDHSIGALTRLRIADIPAAGLASLRQKYSTLSDAIDRHELAKIAAQREWTTSLGQRTASERIAHLFCELFWRLRSIGSVDGDSCEFPLTQSDLADACGLTAVHVNRTLQELRRDEMIVLERRRLIIPNLDRLMDHAAFRPNYLHFASKDAGPIHV